MKYLSISSALAALSVSQALAATDGPLDMEVVYRAKPALKHAKPNPSPRIDRNVLASSVISRMRESHPTGHAKASAEPHKTSTKKATKHTTAKKSRGKKAGKVQHKHAKRQATSTANRATLSTTSAGPTCVSQTMMYTYTPSPNNATGFIADTNMANFAASALAPLNYTRAFAGAVGSLYSTNYLGYYQLATYDVTACSALCTSTSGCVSYNIYHERDPSLNPGPGCLDPTAGVSVRCALWGSATSYGQSQAQNLGEWRQNFMVIVTGSNGYNLNTPPSTYANYTVPQPYLGAVAPSSPNYIASTFYSGPAGAAPGSASLWDPSQCTAACNAQTVANQANYNATSMVSTYQACNFVNAFKLVYNGTLQGTYCRLFNDTAPTLIPSNTNQYTSTSQSGVTYDINNSYGYAPSTFNSTCTNLPSSDTNNTYVDAQGARWSLRCGTDSSFNDIVQFPATTFSACLTLCDQQAGCNTAVLTKNNCWLKSKQNPAPGMFTPNTGPSDAAYKY